MSYIQNIPFNCNVIPILLKHTQNILEDVDNRGGYAYGDRACMGTLCTFLKFFCKSKTALENTVY